MKLGSYWMATPKAYKRLEELRIHPVRDAYPNAHRFLGGELPSEEFRVVCAGNPAREARVGLKNEPDYYLKGRRNPYYG